MEIQPVGTDILQRHLESMGYPCGPVIIDEQMHRFEIEKGDRKAGYYKAWRNELKTGGEFLVIYFGSWKKNESHIFNTLSGKKLSKCENESVNEAMKRAKEEAEKIREDNYIAAATECREIYRDLLSRESEPKNRNSYLLRKQIYECEVLDIRISNNIIYVPIYDIDFNLWSIETISGDGFKKAHKGGRKSGNFNRIGNTKTGPIYFCEGFATAASVHMATGNDSICTFGSSGLKKVAIQFKERYPNRELIIVGDLDKPNFVTSKLAAQEAASAVSAKCIFPKFTNGKGTDFNDLHCTEGLDAVKTQLAELSVIPAPRPLETRIGMYELINAPYPDETENFKRKGTVANVAELLKRLGIIVRYNVISKEEEIIIPKTQFSIDNQANASIGLIISWCERVRIPNKNLGSFLTIIADSNPYNPIATWITSEPWDKQSRLNDLYETIKSKNEPLKENLMKAWLVSAVAAAFEPNGVSAHGVLVLQGAQYLGKTMWFKQLVPKDLGVIKTAHILRPDDKDSVFQAISHWLVELGELDATFRKSDIAQLKGFITNDRDVIRRPYAKKESSYARRTVFFGSVNEEDYLKDVTGNRRFWTIPCTAIDYHHTINMQQLWAEVYEDLYLKKERWMLTDEQILHLNTHNKKFEPVEAVEERILEAIEFTPRIGWVEVSLSATQVCQEIGIHNPTNPDCKTAGRIMRKFVPGPIPKHKGIDKFKCYVRSKVFNHG